MSKCRHCQTEIAWYFFDKRKIPIEPTPHPDGTLTLFEGKLSKARVGDSEKYRSHLTTCKKLRDALYQAKHITLGREDSFQCDKESCEVIGRHFHCYTCGQVGHFANNCEEEPEAKELVM